MSSHTAPDFASPGALAGRWTPGLNPGISGPPTQGQLAHPVPSRSHAPQLAPTISQHSFSIPSASNPASAIAQHPYPVLSNTDVPPPTSTHAHSYPLTDFLSSFPRVDHGSTPPSGLRTFAPPADIPTTPWHRPNLSGPNVSLFVPAHDMNAGSLAPPYGGTPTPSGSRMFAPPADIPTAPPHRPNISGRNVSPVVPVHDANAGLLNPPFMPSGARSLPDISRWEPEPPLVHTPKIPTKNQWKAILAISIVTYLMTYILKSPGIHKWRGTQKEMTNAHTALKAVNKNLDGSESSK